MNFDLIIGVDVAKATLDMTGLLLGEKHSYNRIANQTKSIQSYIKAILKEHQLDKNKILVVAEYTGSYNDHLVTICENMNLPLWQCSSVHIIRSSGLQRGKTDKIDSLRIAQFAYRNIDQYRPHIPMRAGLKQIKRLFAVRRNLIKSRKQIKSLTKDYDFLNPKLVKAEKSSIMQTIKVLDVQIKNIEEEIKLRVLNDRKLSRLFLIMTSIKGISFVTTVKILIVTNEFKKIKNGKALACHAGVAPFQFSSGTSISKQTRVSPMADKELKKLLHMAAVSAISHPSELRNYYLRKVEQGKHKMKVINNVRNKLIHRIIACVKDDRIYQNNFNKSLVGT